MVHVCHQQDLLNEIRNDIKQILADVAVLKAQKQESTAMKSWTVPAIVSAIVAVIMKLF